MEVILNGGTKYLTSKPILFAGGHVAFRPFIQEDKEHVVDCEDIDKIVLVQGSEDSLEVAEAGFHSTIDNILKKGDDNYA